jgi:two-component system, cell cycle sensor histidine kinase and response regulator CckA
VLTHSSITGESCREADLAPFFARLSRGDAGPDGGTTFTVFLARSTRPQKRRVERDRVDEPTAGLRVFLIDDEELVRASLGAMLEALGHDAVLRGDGVRGAKTVADGSDIDLVLLDLVMPGLNGPAVFDLLRKQAPDLPILIMSGHSVDGEAQGLIDRGAVGFLQKPCGLTSLKAALADATRPARAGGLS